MKVMIFDKGYNACVNPSYPCRECALKGGVCGKISAAFCIEYGGFQSSDTKIFTL